MGERLPRPFTVECTECGTRRTNTESVCPTCGRTRVRYSPHEAQRWNREVEELGEGQDSRIPTLQGYVQPTGGLMAVKERIQGKADWLEEQIDRLDTTDPEHKCLKEAGEEGKRLGEAIIQLGEGDPRFEEAMGGLVDRYDGMAGKLGEAAKYAGTQTA